MQEKRDSRKKYVVKVIKSKREKETDKHIPSDILGSYTGLPYFGEVPEQDQDDL